MPYWEKMRLGMSQFPGRALFVLSGSDLTAQEFVQQTNTSQVAGDLGVATGVRGAP